MSGPIVDIGFIKQHTVELVSLLETISSRRRISIEASTMTTALDAACEVDINERDVDKQDLQSSVPPTSIGSVAPLLNVICRTFNVNLPLDCMRWQQYYKNQKF